MNKQTFLTCLSVLFFSLTLAETALAQHKGISFQAVLKDPNGEFPNASGLTVTLQILDPVGNCVLREEVHSGVNISAGYLNLVIGASGPAVSVPIGTNPSPILTMQQLMDNSKAINGFGCIYNPQAHHARKLRVITNIPRVAGGIDPVEADFNMRAVAYAVNSETLNGKQDTDLVNINNAKGVTQTNVESIFERFTKLDAILNNSNGAGNTLGVNITGSAATAATAANVTGTVAIANGGTGGTTAAAARTSLGLGPLSTLIPTGTADNTTYLRGDGTWQTVSGGGGAESDPTVQAFAKGAPGSGLEVVSGTTLQVKIEDIRTQAAGTWGINVTGAAATAGSAANFTGSLVGDVSGTQGATSVDKIKGRSLDNTAPVDGQVLLWDNTNSTWKAQYVRMQDVRNAWGGTEMIPTASCSANQAMVWSAITDRFVCQNINNLNASVVSAGTMAPARLGSGTADTTTYLRGDGTWQTISASDASKLPLAGGTMTGSINMGGQKITNIGNVPFVATNPAVGQDGQSLRWNNTNSQWEWFTAGTAGAGITSFNGQSNSAQSFSPASSASSYGFSSAAGVHTLSIPSASTAGVTAGTISKSDYDSFNSKLGTATTFVGDVSGAYNATSVDSIKGKAVTAPTASGQYMVYNGTSWVNVSMSGDSTMAASGAVTLKNTGTAGTYAKVTTDAQGRVTAGSTLAASDVPALDWSKITTGKPTTLSGYGITDGATSTNVNAKVTKAGDSMTGALTMNAANEVRFADSDSSNYVGLRSPAAVAANRVWVLPAADGSANQVLKTDGAGNLGWVSAGTGSVTNVTGTAPISVATGTSTPVVSIATANTTTTGALSSADWNIFNNKLGTATTFVGDVSGAYNATSVDSIKGKAVTAPTASGQYMVYNGTSWVNVSMSGDSTMAASGAVTLKNTGTAGTYAKVTTDAQGRVTAGSALVAADIPGIPASKITSGTFDDSFLAGLSIDKLISATGKYFDYKPNGVACNNGQTLSYTTGTGWGCSSPATGTVTSVSGTGPIVSSGGATPVISITQATTSTSGYVSSADWNTFNNKQNSNTELSAVGGLATSGILQRTGVGTYTTLGVTAPLGVVANNVVISQANSTTPGYLSAAHWNTFNGKQSALGFTPLNPANNLSDVASVATARGNLGLATVASSGSYSDLISKPTLGTLAGLSSVDLSGSQATGVIHSDRLPASAKYWTAATGGINFSGGKVGVGTTSPGASVDIRSHASYANATMLTSNINASATTISVSSTAGYPSSGVLLIDEELVSYTGVTGTSFTGVVRGFTGSVAATHLAGAFVEILTIYSNGNVKVGVLTSSQVRIGGSASKTVIDSEGAILPGKTLNNEGDSCAEGGAIVRDTNGEIMICSD